MIKKPVILQAFFILVEIIDPDHKPLVPIEKHKRDRQAHKNKAPYTVSNLYNRGY